MTQTLSAVYSPPSPDLPYIAVILSPEARVIAAHAFPTREAAEGFIQAFMQEKAGEHGLTIQQGRIE